MANSAFKNQNVRINCRVCSLKISRQEIIFILCVTVLCCGVEFGYDVPGSLQVYMMDQENYGLTSSQYSLFYSLYALPNIFLCFFGGFLIDNALGIRTSTIFYMMIAFIGSSLFALGGFVDIFWLMLLGRLLFGLGTEMGSSVCLNYLTFTRFKNTNMNLVFSISDNFGYIGTIAVYQVSYRLYHHFKEEYSKKTSLKIVLIITSSVFLISSVCGVLMTYLNPSDKMTALPNEDPEVVQPQEKLNKSDKKKKKIEMKDFVNLFDTIVNFPSTFWLLCLTSTCFANAIYTFESFSQAMFNEVYGLKVEEAGDLITVLSVTKIVFSIPLSMIVDRVGCNTAFVALAIVTAIKAHTLIFLKVDPQICMGLLGLSYTMMGSSIVPMFAYPLSKQHYGLCYGLVTSFANLSLFLCPMIAGKLIDKFGYHAAEIFYLSGLAIGLVTIIFVWILDKKSDGILTMTPRERLAYEQRPLKIQNGEVDL